MAEVDATEAKASKPENNQNTPGVEARNIEAIWMRW